MTETPPLATPAVMVVVLNWNNWPDTVACLESLAHVREPAHRVLVVDNGSEDGSEAQIRAHYPDIEVLQTGANLGYAGGNNVGIRHALARGADYVCILNNDVTVEPGFLGPLVDALAQTPDTGIASPLIADMANHPTVWALGAEVDRRSGATLRSHAGEPLVAWEGAPAFPTMAAPGTAMLVKNTVFARAGLIDESFFLYYEEIDWCLECQSEGIAVVAVPGAIVRHKVSSALGQASPLVDYYMLRNELLFLKRNWTGFGRLRVIARAVARDLSSIAAYTVKPHGGARTPNRNARLLALRDAALGRWGKMGPDVEAACARKVR